MRARWLLVASGVLLVAGAVAAVVGGDDHVGPAGCGARVARELDIEPIGEPSVAEDGDTWVTTVAANGVIVRVTGTGHDVTGVEALRGPGVDVLARPARLRALEVEC